MKTSTKNVTITAIASIISAIIGFTVNDKMDLNQTININIDGETKKISSSDYENILNINNQLKNTNNELLSQKEKINNNNIELQQQNEDLKIQNKQLSDEITQLKNSINNISNNNSELKQNITYLNNLPIFNCQFYDRGTWEATDLYEWNNTDKAADGKKYNNATHMAIHGNWAGFAQTIVIDYLLNSEYKILNGNFILDEISKSTTTIATLNIYGDDKLIYTFENITGGLTPQNTGNIPVKNVDKLRFEFISEQGELGNYDNHFGVVFYDTILE